MSYLPTTPPLYPFGRPDKFYKAAEELQVRVLGELPMVSEVSAGGDDGRPVVIAPTRTKTEGGSVGNGVENVKEVMGRVARDLWKSLR